MAWGVPKIGTLVEDATGNFTMLEPAGVVQGDLMVACIGWRSNAAVALDASWTLVATQQNSGDTDATNGIASGAMYWIVRGASAPVLTATRTLGDVLQCQILAWRGNQKTSPFTAGTANTLGSASQTVTTGTFNTAQANELIVAMVSCGDNLTTSAFDATDPATASGATDTTTAPTVGTWIERADNGTGTGADHGLAIADAIRGTAGATGTIQATVSASARHVMIAASFKMEVPPTIALDTADAHDFGADSTPTLEATGTDGNADDVRYNIQIDPAITFDSGPASIDDSYEVADIQATLQITDTNERMAQSFLSQGGNLDSAKFLLAKIGSPTGNLRVKIYAHSGTYGTSSVPTGAALATASEVLDVTTLPATAGITWFTFNFVGAERIALTPGTHYCVAIEYDGTGTGSDTPLVGYDNSSATHGGNRSTFNSTIWNAGTNDLEFYVYTAGPLLDKVSGTDAGFLNTVSGGDTDPFNSGEKASFTVQAGEELDDGTYYWRARAIDPNGSNTYSSWATARTFTITSVAAIPNKLFISRQAVKRASVY